MLAHKNHQFSTAAALVSGFLSLSYLSFFYGQVPPKTDGGLPKARTDINLTVVGTLEDRSELSDEMARLCAKLPVYAMVKGNVKPIDFSETRQTANPENVLKARK